MNKHQLFDAIGQVDDDLILAADRPAVHRRKKSAYWMPAVSAAACAGLLMLGVVGWRAVRSGDVLAHSNAAVTADGAPETAAATAPDDTMLQAANPYADEGSENEAAKDAGSRIALAAQRAVMLEGTVYYDTGTVSNTDANAAPDGTITSTVDDLSFPEEDGQSNFGTGYAYRYGSTDGTLEVLIDGEWHIFAAD